MTTAESNVKLPAVEVEAAANGMALVTIRTDYEQAARDDEGTMWQWEERRIETPMVEGLAEMIEADIDAWVDFADSVAAAKSEAEEAASALRAAQESLVAYQDSVDEAICDLYEKVVDNG